MRLAPFIAAAALAGGTLVTFGFIQGCGSDTPSGPPGGPVSGAADNHCAMAQETSQASCQAKPDAAPPGTPDAAEESDYGSTMYNQSGDDDDCKYHYAWTSTPIYRSYDIHFTLTLTNKTDGTPATGADPYIEATLDDKFSAPPTDQKANEKSPGVYDIGPMQFDMPGMWLVRFHVFHTCLDLVDTSPHGHAAFFIKVP
jgi:hypothetical protein